MRARALLRANRRSTIVLALLAGVAAGVVLAGWAAARRGSSALDRFEAATAAPDLSFFTCGPGAFVLEEDSVGCPEPYLPTAERAVAAGLDGVDAVGIMAAYPLWFEDPSGGPGDDMDAVIEVVIDDAFPTVRGTPMVIAGRLPTPDAGNELVIDEDIRDLSGLDVGSVITVRGYPIDQGISFIDGPRGDPIEMEVVGVTRTPEDLAARPSDELTTVDGAPQAGTGWFEQYGRHLTPFGYGVAVRTDDIAATRAALVAAFPDHDLQFEETITAESRTVERAVAYETSAIAMLTTVLAMAMIVLVGLAITRQAARDDADRATLSALGATRRDRMATAVLRALPVAGAAMVVAAAVAVASSALTPIGLAAKAEVDAGVRVDGLVLAGGLAALGLLVLGAFIGPAFRRDRDPVRLAPARASTRAGTTGIPIPVAIGLGLAFPGRSGARSTGLAVAAGAAALAVVVGAGVLVASLGVTLDDPERYGVSWDATIEGPLNHEEEQAMAARLRSDDRITAVAGQLGVPARIDGRVEDLYALDQVDGESIAPVIAVGREPIRPGEVALGGSTMRRLGKRIGDRVTLSPNAVPADDARVMEVEAEIVGQAVLNDTFSAEAGDGALLPADWLRQLDETAYSEQFVVRLRADASVADVRAEYGRVAEPTIQTGLASLRRIAVVPWLLAGTVAVLAGGVMALTLVASVRRSRRTVAILRTLGLTGGQVRAAVAWQATALGAAAVVIGIPVGLVVGRVGWRSLATSIGIVTSPASPTVVVLGAIAALVLLANVVAFGPGRAAARARTADALRVE